MIKVTCEVSTYSETATPNIRVYNHWNDKDKVEIEIDGKRYTVVADDMIRAVNNCTNTK